MAQFKAWCTRKLQPDHPGRRRFWTEGASKRWINDDAGLAKAIEYTLEAQEQKNSERLTGRKYKPEAQASGLTAQQSTLEARPKFPLEKQQAVEAINECPHSNR